MSFNNLISKVDKFTGGTVTVDLSEWAGEGECVILREPNISELMSVVNDIPNYQKNNPDLPVDLIFNVAMLAACHVSPDPDPETPIGKLYLQLATERNPLVFLAIQTEFRSAFGWVDEYLSLASNKKK